MPEFPSPPPRFDPPSRGVNNRDVELAADALLRTGERPTIEKIREKIGRGSPNTINPLLDAWWKRLASRLDSGPAAFHRLPESVAHVAEALWMQALDEGRRRALLEQCSAERAAAADRQALRVRSHVLSLREGELEARLKDRERTQTVLESQLRELALLLRKGEATREAQARRIAALEDQTWVRARKSAAASPAGKRPARRVRTRKAAKKRPAGKFAAAKRRR